MAERAGAPGSGFRAAHLAVACAGAFGAFGIAALDATEWVRWLTAGGEVTGSRRERVAIARALLILAASGIAVLGLAGALLPDVARRGYRSARRAVDATLAGRKREQGLGRFALVATPVLAVLLGLAAAVHRLTGTPLSDLTRDPASVMGAAPWIGLLSHVGVLLWASTAVVCFLGAVLLRDREEAPRKVRCLRDSGALVTFLLLDDLFLLHESILPGVTGLPEIVFAAAPPVLFIALLARHGATILTLDWSLLLIATGLLGISLGIDTVWDSARRSFVEDAFKLAGILAWLVFSVRAVRAWLSEPPPGASRAARPTAP